MSPPTDRRAGFTLLEVLAALVITSLLVAVVLPFVGQLVGRWRSGQGSVEVADAWMQAEARLGDDLAEAVPLQVGPPGQGSLKFRLDPRRVEFVRPALGGAGKLGLDLVSYAIEPDPSGQRLVRRARPFDPSGEAEDGAGDSTITILEGPYRLRFAAIGPDGLRRDDWSDPRRTPVRIDLLATGQHGPAPVSRIALPLSARANITLLGTTLGQ